METTGTTFSNGKAIDQSSLNHDSTPSLTCSVCLHERPRTTHVYSRLTDHSLHHRSTKTTHRSSIASSHPQPIIILRALGSESNLHVAYTPHRSMSSVHCTHRAHCIIMSIFGWRIGDAGLYTHVWWSWWNRWISTYPLYCFLAMYGHKGGSVMILLRFL